MIAGTGVDTCPKCNAGPVGVIDSRRMPRGRRRRRQCLACEHRWFTVEIEAGTDLVTTDESIQRAKHIIAEAIEKLHIISGNLIYVTKSR